MKPKKSSTTTATAEMQTCRSCQGPLEFWGVSSACRLFRCVKCGVIHHVEWGAPLYAPCRGEDPRCGDGWLRAV